MTATSKIKEIRIDDALLARQKQVLEG